MLRYRDRIGQIRLFNRVYYKIELNKALNNLKLILMFFIKFVETNQGNNLEEYYQQKTTPHGKRA